MSDVSREFSVQSGIIVNLPVGATFELANGTWTVAEITGAGTHHWSVKVRRLD
uniref:Uncharacterized protein n=1 Tax=Streptomyces sp. NBC_00049 TaxID=2903617 RepID=A0AAU2JME0_9ACTN